MAYNTGFIAGSEIHTIAESPNLDGLQTDSALKYPKHRLNGTFPKDLSLPKKKSLFEDEQSKGDEILQKHQWLF